MLMQAIYDVVLVETVGVGQSEIEIAGIVDVTVLCVQPASGDSLQFLKSGVMEVPDMIVVTKSDIGGAARRAAADLRSAMSVTGDGTRTAIHLVSSQTGEGVAESLATLLSFRVPEIGLPQRKADRMAQAIRWHEDAMVAKFGTFGLAKFRAVCKTPSTDGVFAGNANAVKRLASALEDVVF